MNNNDKFHKEHSEDIQNHMSEDFFLKHTSDESLEKMSKMTTEEIINEHMELIKKDGTHSDVDENILRKHIEEMVKSHSKEGFNNLKSKELTSEDIIKLHNQE